MNADVNRFINGLIDRPKFREEIGSADAARIATALEIIGIILPDPFQERLIEACVHQGNTDDGWLFMNNIRKALCQDDDGGVN